MFKLILTILAIIVLYLLFGGIVFSLLSSFFELLAHCVRWLGKLVDWYGVSSIFGGLF